MVTVTVDRYRVDVLMPADFMVPPGITRDWEPVPIVKWSTIVDGERYGGFMEMRHMQMSTTIPALTVPRQKPKGGKKKR